MTDQKPPDETNLDAEIAQVRRTMTYLTQLLELMEDEVMEGDPVSIKDAAKLLGEIRNWSKTAMETEARFEERRKKKDGVAYDYALDLDEARFTISRRLARLRDHAGAGAVPE